MKVYIDAACDILYSSFYIKGLEEYYGRKNIYYKNKPFKQFKFNNHFFSYVVKDAKIEKNIIIDFSDTANINFEALEWSSLYLKINIDEKKDYHSDKIISIGPGFGINVYSKPKTIYLAITNYLKAYKRISNKRLFFSNYNTQLKRSKIEEYYPNIEQDNYIYFVGTLWKNEPQTNIKRANFIRACLTKNIEFEGGFAPRTKNDIEGFEDLTISSRHKIKTFVQKTKKSNVVFNTPAVLDCHGWKLGEFLCFGKAIITTNFTRKLPKELIDKQDLLFTDGSQKDIEEKLDLLINDHDFRLMLKKNARNYYESELAPSIVIQKTITLFEN